VHRYYESRRRKFNDSQPHRLEKAKMTKKNQSKKYLRTQVLIKLVSSYKALEQYIALQKENETCGETA